MGGARKGGAGACPRMAILRIGGAFWAAARCTDASTAVTTKSTRIFLPIGLLLLPVSSCVFALHRLCASLRVAPQTIPQECGQTQFPHSTQRRRTLGVRHGGQRERGTSGRWQLSPARRSSAGLRLRGPPQAPVHWHAASGTPALRLASGPLQPDSHW